MADSTGRRNTFDRGVYGATCRLDAKIDGTRGGMPLFMSNHISDPLLQPSQATQPQRLPNSSRRRGNCSMRQEKNPITVSSSV